MTKPPPQEKQVCDQIERLRAKRNKRVRFRLFLVCGLGAMTVLLAVATAVLATREPSDPNTSEHAAGLLESTASTTGAVTTGASGSDACCGSTVTSERTVTSEQAVPIRGIAPASASGVSAAIGPGSTIDHETSPASTTGRHSATSRSVPMPPTTSSSTTTALPAAKVVVIDPGHQAKGNLESEPVGPGSSKTKAKVSSGTSGVVTKIPESELALTVSFKLRDALAAHGIEIIITRITQDVDLSNVQRAEIANEAGADLLIRIHADGSNDPEVAGVHVLYPASVRGWTDDIAAASKQAAALAQQELIAATGASDRGIEARNDMTGFNWSDVPVILVEIGFMTNPDEDRLLATAAYQDKIVRGLERAALIFLGVK